ncbi:MAG: translation initiation factor IF-2 [Clostridia bacterium]
MTKVRVQDATKELSASAEKLLGTVGQSRRQAVETLKALKKLSDDMGRQEREKREQIKREELSKQYEAAAAFMTAYSTEQVPEPVEKPQTAPQTAQVVQSEGVDRAPEKAPETADMVAQRQARPAQENHPTEQASSAPSDQTTQERPATQEQPTTQDRSAAQPQDHSAMPQDRPAFQPRPQQPFQPRPQQPGGPYGRPVGQGPYGRPVQPSQGAQPFQGGTPPQGGQPFQPRPAQPGGPYGRPVGQGPYGRPVGGQGGPYGRPVQPGGQPFQGGQGGQPFQGAQSGGQPFQGGQGQGQAPYGRPFQPGQAGPYGRPVQPAGSGPYGRPVQPGQGGGQYGRPPMQPGQRPGMGGTGPRPAGGAPMGGARTGFGRPKPTELAPTVEKERVSNYDPNKKNYQRPNDPERAKSRQRQMSRGGGFGGDDEFIRGKRKKKMTAFRPEPIKIEKAYMTAESITVKDLTERIGKPAGEIIKKLMLLGIMATINNELDYDTALLVCSEFGVELELKLDKTAEDSLQEEDFTDTEGALVQRAPAVTIMGHVDHGKTSLLDHIRETRVTAGEAGGITQHIGAYTVDINGKKITFLDTPGHEAFTAMRARGAQATDIAVLVVAADDGVMPQTIEAINHAKAAGVPTIVAINKMDKPGANPERIRQQLTEYGLVAEEWGGDTIMVEVSATTGAGIDKLLEMILLVAELQNYRANPDRKARGIIIEARLDKSRGPVATVLIKNGTLRIGDMVVAGTAYGRVRAMVNDRGERVKEAGPSDPVEVIGFGDVPDAGDTMSAVDDDKLSRQVAEERKDKLRAALVKPQQTTTLDDLFDQISAGQIKDLNLIVKADVQGSVEAVKQSLEKLSGEEVRVRCIHGGVGAINESDVMLASVSNAIIIGFNVRMDNSVRDMAEHEKVDIRLYRVIYTAIEEIQAAMKGMLTPKFKENVLGRAQVRQTFRVTGVGMIAGSYVTDGKIVRNAQARLLRDNIVVHEAKVESLKRFKDDAKEVATGFECGIGLENYNDVKEGDVIECYEMEEIAQ